MKPPRKNNTFNNNDIVKFLYNDEPWSWGHGENSVNDHVSLGIIKETIHSSGYTYHLIYCFNDGKYYRASPIQLSLHKKGK